MDAVNELHKRICDVEKELEEATNLLNEKSETASTLRRTRETASNRLEAGRQSVAKADKAIERKQEELEGLLSEVKRVEDSIAAQQLTLRTLTGKLVSECNDFETFSSLLNRRMCSMYKELENNGMFRVQLEKMHAQLKSSRETCKAEENARKTYRQRMLEQYKLQIQEAEHALSSVATYLSSVKAARTQKSDFGGFRMGDSSSSMAMPPQYSPRYEEESSLASLTGEPPVASDAAGAMGSEIVPLGDAWEPSSPISQQPFVIPAEETYSEEVTVSMRYAHDDAGHIRMSSSELSVMPWFHAVKKRRIDVYSIHEMRS